MNRNKRNDMLDIMINHMTTDDLRTIVHRVFGPTAWKNNIGSANHKGRAIEVAQYAAIRSKEEQLYNLVKPFQYDNQEDWSDRVLSIVLSYQNDALSEREAKRRIREVL
jgi:hypothetical protein